MNRAELSPNPSAGRVAVLPAIAMVLVIIGGINWGLVGIAGFDLVATICGAGSVPARVVYVLVGLAALYVISLVPRAARRW